MAAKRRGYAVDEGVGVGSLAPGRAAVVRWTGLDGTVTEMPAAGYRDAAFAGKRRGTRLIPDVRVEPAVWDATLVRWFLIDGMGTLMRLPAARGPQAVRSCMPEPVRTAVEAYGYDGVARASVRVRPDAAAITRMDRVLGWLLWINDEDDRLIVAGTALGLSLRAVAYALAGAGRRYCSHETCRKREKAVLDAIAERLNSAASGNGQK